MRKTVWGSVSHRWQINLSVGGIALGQQLNEDHCSQIGNSGNTDIPMKETEKKCSALGRMCQMGIKREKK